MRKARKVPTVHGRGTRNGEGQMGSKEKRPRRRLARAKETKKEDIVIRLRRTRANMIGTDDEEHYWDCVDAAIEIERLRGRKHAPSD